MDKQKKKPVYPVLFVLSVCVTLAFFYILFIFSSLIVWIVIPMLIIFGFTITTFLGVFSLLLVKARRKQQLWLKEISLGGLSSTFLIIVLVLMLPLLRTGESSAQLPNQQQNLLSQSGKYVLNVPIKRIREKFLSFGRPYRVVTISDSNGKVIYQDEEKTFPGWFKTYWIWDKQDRVWLFGSDAGVCFYENIKGKWTKQHWHDGLDVSSPDSLYPDSFKRNRTKSSGLIKRSRLEL